jgi:hypothetical protein
MLNTEIHIHSFHTVKSLSTLQKLSSKSRIIWNNFAGMVFQIRA